MDSVCIKLCFIQKVRDALETESFGKLGDFTKMNGPIPIQMERPGFEEFLYEKGIVKANSPEQW